MTITSTTEAERLIEKVLRIDAEAFGGRWEVLTDGCGRTCIFSQYGDGGCILTEDVGGGLYKHEAEATAALIALYRTAAPRLAHLLRASEEARVKAEREGDQLRASYAEMNKLSAAAHHEWALAEERAEADETALADMRRERDASDAALNSMVRLAQAGGANLERDYPEHFETILSASMRADITAARSRAKLDGEEKKL